jgi:hypothetical protein
LRKIIASPITTCEYTIYYKNLQHTCNTVAEHWTKLVQFFVSENCNPTGSCKQHLILKIRLVTILEGTKKLAHFVENTGEFSVLIPCMNRKNKPFCSHDILLKISIIVPHDREARGISALRTKSVQYRAEVCQTSRLCLDVTLFERQFLRKLRTVR